MPRYDLPVPRPRGMQVDNEQCEIINPEGIESCVRDMILHILLGRITSTDNTTYEIETVFNPELNAIDIDIPEHYLEMIESVGIGPNLQRYLDWLRQPDSIIGQLSFISSTLFDIWYGAMNSEIDGSMNIIFPASDSMAIGYNMRSSRDFKVILVWQYIGGNNTNLEIKMTAAVQNSSTRTNIINISTKGVVQNTIYETELMTLSDINESIISFMILRNYLGSLDPHTETIGMIGLRLEDV